METLKTRYKPTRTLRKYFITGILEHAYKEKMAVVITIVSSPYSVSFRGNGKTSYALRSVAAYYYFVHGYGLDKAWEKALDNLVFTVDELIGRVESSRPGDIIIADDIGYHVPRRAAYSKEDFKLFSEIDVFRTKGTGIVFTAPHIKRLPTQLIMHSEYLVYVARLVGWSSKAHIYKLMYSMEKPYLNPRFQKIAEETFPTRYPNKIYNKYIEKRLKALHERNI